MASDFFDRAGDDREVQPGFAGEVFAKGLFKECFPKVLCPIKLSDVRRRVVAKH